MQDYRHCVTAFDIPSGKEIVADTLEFTYNELVGPPGLVCTIGGLPNAYISVGQLRN